jgi:hypothetical protein
VIIGASRVLYRELKDWRVSSQPSPDQVKVLALLGRAGQDADIWRPCDWFSGRIVQELTTARRPRSQNGFPVNDQLPLFPTPDGRIPKQAPMSVDIERVYFRKYRSRTRTLCDQCIKDIHERGIAVAPLPQPVMWKHATGNIVELLCDRHCRERKGETGE